MRDFYEVCGMICGKNVSDELFALGIKSEDVVLPSWYSHLDLDGAIYEEVFGLGCLHEWIVLDAYKDSDAIYTAGENVFIHRNGHDKLMKQRVTPEQKHRLIGVIGSRSSYRGDCCFEVIDAEIRITREPINLDVTKQDIAIMAFDRLRVEDSKFTRVAMRKTNSLEVELYNGQKYKIVVKSIGEDD